MENVEKASVIVTLSVTVVASLFAAFGWMNYKFEQFASDRLEAYEYLLLANMLKDSGKFERATLEYDKALNSFLEMGVTDDRLASVIDPYLDTLANVEKPHKYEHHLNRLLTLSKNKLASNGDRYNSLGWIYLNTQRASLAIVEFKKSISIYRQENNEYNVDQATWGLTLSELSLGNLRSALEYYYQTWDYDYGSYTPEDIVNYPLNDEDYGQRLSKIYPPFYDSYSGFVSYLQEVHEVQPLDNLVEEINDEVLSKNTKGLNSK